jgi:hypothetical protein
LKTQNSIIEPLVESLAIDIDGHCSTGTATFQAIPKQFHNGRPWQIPLQRLPESQSGRNRCLVLDHAFLGITPLYSPRPENHRVE